MVKDQQTKEITILPKIIQTGPEPTDPLNSDPLSRISYKIT